MVSEIYNFKKKKIACTSRTSLAITCWHKGSISVSRSLFEHYIHQCVRVCLCVCVCVLVSEVPGHRPLLEPSWPQPMYYHTHTRARALSLSLSLNNSQSRTPKQPHLCLGESSSEVVLHHPSSSARRFLGCTCAPSCQLHAAGKTQRC